VAKLTYKHPEKVNPINSYPHNTHSPLLSLSPSPVSSTSNDNKKTTAEEERSFPKASSTSSPSSFAGIAASVNKQGIGNLKNNPRKTKHQQPNEPEEEYPEAKTVTKKIATLNIANVIPAVQKKSTENITSKTTQGEDQEDEVYV
jgi:hypothetical protein